MSFYHISLVFLFVVHPAGYKAPHHKPPEHKPVAIVKTIPAPPSLPPPPPVPPPPTPPLPLPAPTFPVAPVGTYINTYAPYNCTSYVASRIKIPNTWGNAATWAIRAAAEGITVSNTPVVGAIAQHGGGFGHVAVTLKVDDGQVLIAEQNYDYQGSIRERWAATSEFIYIYI